MAPNRPERTSPEGTPTVGDSRLTGFAALQDHWLEFVTVLLIASASLAAAWGGYQAARWGGVQSTLYSKAGAVRVESTRSQNWGQLLAITDLNIQSACEDTPSTEADTVLTFPGNSQRAEARDAQDTCYEKRFSVELRAAMDAWPDTASLQNPEALDTSVTAGRASDEVDAIVRRKVVESKQLEAEAEHLFAKGQAANQQGDDYVLTTVFLATVLFFGGLSSQIKWLPLRIGFLGFAGTLLGFSIWRLMAYPIM